MYFLYSLLFTLGIILLLPRFALDLLRHGKYAEGLKERLGRLAPLDAAGRPVIWLHCVSVGETQAARPLVQALRERYPEHALAVSTTTRTGQQIAREVFRKDASRVFYFPFDWAWTVRRALAAINPSVVLIMETELWPRFLRECGARQTPVAIVNGRISARSFRGYQRLGKFIKPIVNHLTLAVMQTEDDAARILALGAHPTRVRIAGNVKFDVGADDQSAQTLTGELRARFGWSNARPLIVAASTHAPEERIIIEAFKELQSRFDARARLLIAPRHPERFDEVASLLSTSGFSWTRRTDEPRDDDMDCDVILLDSIGELRAVYPLAEIVFVGGSIAPKGGHNALEPAAAAKCIVTGAHTENFAAITREFLAHDALLQLAPVAEEDAPGALARELEFLLRNDARRHTLAANARATLAGNRGATARTVDFLAPLLAKRLEIRSQKSTQDDLLYTDS